MLVFSVDILSGMINCNPFPLIVAAHTACPLISIPKRNTANLTLSYLHNLQEQHPWLAAGRKALYILFQYFQAKASEYLCHQIICDLRIFAHTDQVGLPLSGPIFFNSGSQHTDGNQIASAGFLHFFVSDQSWKTGWLLRKRSELQDARCK